MCNWILKYCITEVHEGLTELHKVGTRRCTWPCPRQRLEGFPLWLSHRGRLSLIVSHRITLSITFFAILAVNSQAQQASLASEAADFVGANKTSINSVLRDQFGLDPDVAISLVLPEVGRFSSINDFAETSALQVFYIQLGKDYANFSIGRFQMKPSFAEGLEEALISGDYPQLLLPARGAPADAGGYAELFAYKQGTPEFIRSQRIERLCSREWQLRYLGLFCRIMECKFGEKLSKDNLELFAGAYNLGWQCSTDEILSWNRVASFPSGKRKSSDRSYAVVAKEYYEELKHHTHDQKTSY